MTFPSRKRLSFAIWTVAVVLVASVAPVQTAGSALSRYRGVALGDSTAAVMAVLDVPASDVKIVNERPSLVQEITWSPHRFISGKISAPDSLAGMVLTFHAGRLVRIVATYDRERTAGLTEADFQDAIGAGYGATLLQSNASWTAPQGPMDRKTFGRWEDPDTLVLLWSDRYPSRTGLTISTIAADALMQEAVAEGKRLDAAEAPARELALREANAAALRTRNEKIRLENKAAFKP
jgi:hypothetical protein